MATIIWRTSLLRKLYQSNIFFVICLVMILFPKQPLNLISSYNKSIWVVMKCKLCTKILIKKNSYKCCGKKDHICVSCSQLKCSSCVQQGLEKQNIKQCGTYKKMYQQADRLSCSLCEKLISQSYEPFHDQNCGYIYCYSCILRSYERYLRILEQLREACLGKSEIGVDVDCGCEYGQVQIIKFIKKCCYICKESLGKEDIYQLNNNTSIMKRCYQKLTRNIELRLANQEQKWLLIKIKKMLLRCFSCGKFISQIGNQDDDICLCKNCLRQSSIIESAYVAKRNQEAYRINQKVQQKKLQKSSNNQIHEQMAQERSLASKFLPRQIQQVNILDKIFQKSSVQLSAFQKKEITISRFPPSKVQHRPQDPKNNIKQPENVSSYGLTKFCILCARLFQAQQQGEQAKICYACLQKQLSIHNQKISQTKSHEPVLTSQKNNAIDNGLIPTRPITHQKALLPSKHSFQEANSKNVELFSQHQCKQLAEKQKKIHLIQSVSIEDQQDVTEQLKISRQPANAPQGFCPITILNESQQCSLYLLQIDLEQIDITLNCCACTISLRIDSALKVYNKLEQDSTSLRVAQTQQELEKYSSDERMKIYCKLCYFYLKASKLNRVRDSAELLRSCRSMPKKEPIDRAYVQKSNIFDKYERRQYGVGKQPCKQPTPVKQFRSKEIGYNDDVRQLLNKKMRISTTTVQCKYCHKEFQTQQSHKINHICGQCKGKYSAISLDNQQLILCRACNNVINTKTSKQGYCLGCYSTQKKI